MPERRRARTSGTSTAGGGASVSATDGLAPRSGSAACEPRLVSLADSDATLALSRPKACRTQQRRAGVNVPARLMPAVGARVAPPSVLVDNLGERLAGRLFRPLELRQDQPRDLDVGARLGA